MNIAVFGWYHHQNAGDDRMQQCITRWLDGHCLAFLPAGRPPPLALLRTYDAVILGGGSIVNPDGGMFRDLSRWVRKVGIPVGIVSVTLDEISPAFRAEFRRFLDLDLCCFAWFRDQESADLVGPHPKVFAAPDITWLFPFGWAEETLDHGPQTTDHGQQTIDHGPQTTDLPPAGGGQPSEVKNPWSTVHGPPSEIHGPGSMVDGPSSPISGPRSMVYGPSSPVQGPGSMVHGLCPPPFPVAVCLRKQRGLPVERWRTVLAALAAQGHELLPWPLYFENGGDAEVLRQCLPEERGARSAEHGAPEAEGMRLAGSGHKGLSAARRKDSRDKTKTQPAIASPAPDTMLSAPCPKPYAPRSALRAPCSIPAEFTLDPVRRAGAVISGRFHGILFALQMGRPVIAVSSLPKTRRFLAENGMEQWCVPEDQPERLLDLWPAFVAKWPELAEAAARVRDRLYSQVTDRAKGTRERLLDDATALPPPPRRRGNRLRQCLDFGQWLDV